MEAWIKLLDQDEAMRIRPDHPYNFGQVANMSRLLMTHPDIGPKFGALFSQIMFEPGQLDRAEREMVAAVAAGAQDCFY